MQKLVSISLVVLMSLSFLLAGCVDPGLGDGEGLSPNVQAGSTTVVNGNYLPVIQGQAIGKITGNYSFSLNNSTTPPTHEVVLQGINVTLYHSSIDPDGSTMVMGWDLDLDSIIDVSVSSYHGFTTLYLPLSYFNAVPQSLNDAYLTTVAFLATDINGGIGLSVVDIGINVPLTQMYVDSNLYAFSAKDAHGTPGVGDTDNLIMITMDQGGDINWAALSVKLEINGNAPVTCDNPGVEGTAVCSLVEYGNTEDQFWSVGDGVTVVENANNLCETACSITVTITDTRIGQKIGSYSAVAE